ncbi:MAG: hypothetical protein M3Q23_00210 [Actinomycetota bacterium]|nr:hypothetical protein [Actinomycetota bacterium]
MGYDIERRAGMSIARGGSRQVGREIAAVEDFAIYRASVVRAKAFVAKAAMLEAANLSMLQELLARQSPQAELRLTALGDAAAMAMTAEILRLA